MARPLTPETRLRHRVRDLERIVSAWRSILLEPEVWQYIEALSAIHHIAHHGIRRPEDLGGNITGRIPHSTGTRLENEALLQWKTELAHLRQRTGMLHGVADQQDGGKRNGKATA